MFFRLYIDIVYKYIWVKLLLLLFHYRKDTNVISLKSRYTNLYIPSDFFNANFSWTEAFPLVRPFQLGHHCNFHVLHKDVETVSPSTAVLDPPDADHLYSAKVNILYLNTVIFSWLACTKYRMAYCLLFWSTQPHSMLDVNSESYPNFPPI